MRRSARISHRGAHFGHLFFAGVIGCSLAWSNPVRFVDVTAEAGITHSHHSTPASQFSIFTRFHGHQDIVESMTGGVALLDFDQDGWLDLLVANGHLYSNVDNDAEPKLLYRNNRDGTYSEVFSPGGSALLEKRVSRGAAFGDLDNDGDIDVVVNQLDGKPMVLRNEGGNRGNWLRVKAEGRAENRFAVGARIKVVSGDLAQRAEIRAERAERV